MEDNHFDTWFFDNWDTLVVMYKQFQKDNPNSETELPNFINHMYDHGQDLVEAWDQEMVENYNQLKKN